MKRIIASAGLVLVTLVGCSSAGTLAPSSEPIAADTAAPTVTATLAPAPTATPTPLPTPTPVPTPEVSQVAKEAYLHDVSQLNNGGEQAWKAFKKSNQSFKAYKAYFADLAKRERIFTDSVRLIQFPPEMAAHVANLLDKDSTVEIYMLEASKARNWAAMNKITAKLDAAGDAASAASNLVRQDLGLPPPPMK